MVVEEVGKDSAIEKAGIKPGDVVLSWVLAAAPPANPEEARGEIGSPFDLAEIEMEQAPRGDVTLFGTRDHASFSVLIPAGAWAITARPQLAEPMLTAYEQGKDLIAAREIDRAVGAWRQLAAQAGVVKLFAAFGAKASNGLVTTGQAFQPRPQAATANAVVFETSSHSRQRRR